LENTPKGVTLHYIDQGLDTGDIIAQREVFFDTEKETLKTSYEILYIEIVKLFKEKWPDIKNRRIKGVAQKSGGSSHKSSDKKSYEGLLTEKWDTPVRKLIGKAL
jgi:methionyl-tRNA formyltransferase